jgi:predicted AAA+ superfamily ATPase
MAAAVRFNRAYLEHLAAVDLPSAVGVRHNPARLRRLLAALARNLSTEATLRSLAADVAGDGAKADPATIRDYLDALTAVFAYEELPAWSVALRSKSRLRTSGRIHLADPALALAALGVGPERLSRDPEYFGQVFEAMAVHDLRVYAGLEDGLVYHYRDDSGLEVDAVIEYPDWTWGAAEVKLGSSEIPKAEANLLALRDQRVDLAKTGPPRFLAVLTGAEYAYTLPSGVHVVPLGILGP